MLRVSNVTHQYPKRITLELRFGTALPFMCLRARHAHWTVTIAA
jgi:hypothetical protein